MALRSHIISDGGLHVASTPGIAETPNMRDEGESFGYLPKNNSFPLAARGRSNGTVNTHV